MAAQLRIQVTPIRQGVAKWLKADRIPVECLILFDPVDRTGQVGLPWRNTAIADTVKHMIYVQRNPASKSRESFSNCGTRREDKSKTRLSYQMFSNGTHGAMGGTPWDEPKGSGYIDEGPPDGLTNVTVAQDEDLVALDEALHQLEVIAPRASQVVELRFFAGLLEKEVAEVLGISLATRKRDWDFAKAWLFSQLRSQ